MEVFVPSVQFVVSLFVMRLSVVARKSLEHFIPFADMSEVSNSSRYVLEPNSVVGQ